MPEFSTAFSSVNIDRKMTDQEVIRAVRFMIAAEYEAVQMYQQLAECTDNELVKKVMIDVANEEVVHAGEFLKLLKELSPTEEDFYDQGAEEVEEMMEEMAEEE